MVDPDAVGVDNRRPYLLASAVKTSLRCADNLCMRSPGGSLRLQAIGSKVAPWAPAATVANARLMLSGESTTLSVGALLAAALYRANTNFVCGSARPPTSISGAEF